ncbi:MAG: DMT family transporter, partial [Planctomycetota bacterium]
GGAAIVAKRTLETVDRGAFLFVRNAASAVVFLVLGILLFGPHHFAHAFAGNLWIAMLAYAGLISFGGQWAWYRSIDTLPPSTISAVSTLSPLFGIGLAFLLLDEVPSAVQLSGAAIVLAGMALTRIRPPAGAPIHATVGRSLAGG